MIDPACVEEISSSKIKVEENGKSAVVRNGNQQPHHRIRVDGCLQWAGPKADYVIERGRTAVVIELKGRNVEHGADQVFATATRWVQQEKRCDRICGLIVAAQYPKASTAIQIRQNRFAKRFAGPLHVVTKNQEYELEHLLSFKGPCRA